MRACHYPAKLGKCLIDEYEGDEDGEDLLRESRDEPDQEAALHGNYHYDDDHQPGTNPNASHNVFNVLGLAELWKGRYDDDDDDALMAEITIRENQCMPEIDR